MRKYPLGVFALTLLFIGGAKILFGAPATPSTSPATHPATHPAAPVPIALKAMDTAGVVHALADRPEITASAVIFISTECPISNKYIPLLNELAARHHEDRVKIYGR